jgi:hypothetical protein
MAPGFERVRCKNRRQNRLSKRLRPGYQLGRLALGLRPATAVGLGGSVEISAGGASDSTGDEVSSEPGGGSTRNSEGRIISPIAPGASVPLACVAGDRCTPSGGSFGLAGGFDLTFAGRRSSVTSLAVATSGAAPAFSVTVTGVVGGAPVTVATGPAGETLQFTPDFRQRAGAELGTGFDGGMQLNPLFTSTGPTA